MPNAVCSARIAMFPDDSKCYKIIEQESDFVNSQQDLQVMIANDSSWKEHIVTCMISYFHNYHISTNIWQKVKF